MFHATVPVCVVHCAHIVVAYPRLLTPVVALPSFSRCLTLEQLTSPLSAVGDHASSVILKSTLHLEVSFSLPQVPLKIKHRESMIIVKIVIVIRNRVK